MGTADQPSTLKLVLEDGTEMSGRSFGQIKPVAGEVVFNTGMSGYVEALTDPSYRGQILVTTYPLIGNYGVPAPRERGSIELPYESSQIQVQGLVVQNYVNAYSHHSATRSLGRWLRAESIPAVTRIDTRALTRLLRESGTMQGLLFPGDMKLEHAIDCADRVEMASEVFHLVAPAEPVRYPGSGPKILLVDVGAKDNIVRSLLSRGADVTRAPWHGPIQKLADHADGILIGNGPSDPQKLGSLIDQLRSLLDTFNKPIMGICLGHQLLSLAAGANTYKLPYGHRGVNQPVQDLLSRRCFITSQNHGFAVDDDSLPQGWEPWFVNVNDGTNEGIRSQTKPYYSIQFHPEAMPGPQDTGYLFDDYLRLVGAMARG